MRRRKIEVIVAVSFTIFLVVGLAVINAVMFNTARWQGFLPGVQALSYLVAYLFAHLFIGETIRRRRKSGRRN